MKKFSSLLVANLLVILGIVLASSMEKGTSFLHEFFLFIWALSLILIVVLVILIIIDNLMLKSNSLIISISIETSIIIGLFLFLKNPFYFILMFFITQIIKYLIYSSYKSKNKGESNGE